MPRLSIALILCLTFLNTLLCSPTLVTGEEYLLRYKFEPGQVVRYAVSTYDDYLIQLGTVEEKPYSHQDSVKNYRVISVNDDGSAVLELTNMEWVKIEIEQNGAHADYDSRTDKKPEPLFAPLATMVGQPHLRLTISPTGKVSDLQPLIKKDQNVEELAQQILLELPEEPVKVGGIWTEDDVVPVQIGENSSLKQMVKVQRRYFVQSIEKGIVTISVKTKVLTPLGNPDLELQLIRRQPEGTVQLDLERGLLVNRTLTQDNQVLNFGTGAARMDFKQKHTERLLPVQVAQSGSDAAAQ